ncbi:hypothetical protein D3C71_2227870 [compost metagenome]
MLVSDPVFANVDKWLWMPKLEQTKVLHYGAQIAGALLVLALGKYVASRRPKAAEGTGHA